MCSCNEWQVCLRSDTRVTPHPVYHACQVLSIYNYMSAHSLVRLRFVIPIVRYSRTCYARLVRGCVQMAAPRGRYVAGKNSPFPGRIFAIQPNDAPTAPYNRYLQTRAQTLGFSGYSEQRRMEKAYKQDSTYLWSVEKTLDRRFDVEVYGGGYRELLKAGREELNQRVGTDIRWAQQEGIQNLTYEQALVRMYTLTTKSNFDTRANGPYARWLELMGIREESASYDVGDTP